MKGFLVRFMASVTLLTAILASTNVYSQNAGKAAPEATTVTKSLLVAKWKAGDEEYIFDKDGTSMTKIDGRECPGTWVLNGKTVTINPKKLMWKKGDPCSKTKVLEISGINLNAMEAVDKTRTKELHLTKQK